MPSLLGYYQEKVLISQAKKSLAGVLNALALTRSKAAVENNGEIFVSSNTNDQTADLIFENMNVLKRCKSSDYNCLKGYTIKMDKPRNDGFGNYIQPTQIGYFARATLADGSIVAITQTKYSEGVCQNYYKTWDKDKNGNVIVTATPNGNTHGSIIEINGQWYVFFHRQTGTNEFSRQAMVAPINVEVTEGKN